MIIKVFARKTKLRESGHKSEQNLKMKVRNRMWFLTRILMWLERDMGHNLEGNKTKVRVKDSCSVGYAERRISIRIDHCTWVVGLISIVHWKHK